MKAMKVDIDDAWRGCGGKFLKLWAVGDAPEGPNARQEDPRDPDYSSRLSACTDGGWPSNTTWHHTRREAMEEAARRRSGPMGSPTQFWSVELLYMGGPAQAAAVGADFILWHIGAAKISCLKKKWAGWAKRDRGLMGRLVGHKPELAETLAGLMFYAFESADVVA